MGFSLIFVAVDGDEQRDADRAALEAFLTARGLHVEGEPGDTAIVDAHGELLAFDGHRTDLQIDPLDEESPLSGGIDHASLSDAECAFMYDLCVAAGFLLVNPQGDPTYLVPEGNHTPAQLPDPDDTAWVYSGADLQRALSEGFDAFREWRDRAIGRNPAP
jgi:hypothetical protein